MQEKPTPIPAQKSPGALFPGTGRELDRYAFLLRVPAEFLENLYRQYRDQPEVIDSSWRHFFDGFDLGAAAIRESPGGEAAPPVQTGTARAPAAPPPEAFDPREFKVIDLIHGYRTRGHLFTRTNPVRTRRQYSPTLDIQNFGLAPADLGHVFQAGTQIGLGPATLQQIIGHLEETYCASIGAEYMDQRSPDRVEWFRSRMESTRNRPGFSPAEKRHILEVLSRAVVFENFLHAKFVGQKRFSLSGGETLIPGLDALIESGAALGAREFVLGMAHRGRINVLANILRKPYRDIFEEFEGKQFGDDYFVGDVKYHLGYANQWDTSEKHSVRVQLAANPSHLEAVGPVVEGLARGLIEHRCGGDFSRVIPVVIHGDAALAAQGVVYEVVQMSLLDGFKTGGTIHLVINNQLGFTTNYLDGRSSTYCTDVAKVTRSPVLHVNADDAEAVVLAARLAVEYRQTFHGDIFIDLLGYRRWGHNESDEPRFTQPKLYRVIASHPDPRRIYHDKLVAGGDIETGAAAEIERSFRAELQARLDEARSEQMPHCHYLGACDRRRRPADFNFIDAPETGAGEARLLEIGHRLFSIPPQVAVFDRIRKIYDNWHRNLTDSSRCDWVMAEFLAYATLLEEGHPIRISGQDVERGTFSQRHAVLLAEATEEEYVPLNHVREGQASLTIYNSLLSEYAVLGFEYGYSESVPEGLTVWEAQFGDFGNGAQIVIDQYLAAAEAKWNRLNALVLFLPHGYEGQGPEHSSARIERFLSLGANDNLIIANCTTPASFFHLLRRHLKLAVRVPMVVFTPKSLLRHPGCVSPLAELAGGRFQPYLTDAPEDPADVRRVLFCSGKIYYDLRHRLDSTGRSDVALVRLEQLYPLGLKRLEALVQRYPLARRWLWVQEEPANMGAARFMSHKLDFVPLEIVARQESGSPATGFHEIHKLEQQELIDRAFG